MRAALIYQHANRDADRRIADSLSARISGVERPADPTRGAHSGLAISRASAADRKRDASAPVFRGPLPGAGDGNRTRTVSLGIVTPHGVSPDVRGLEWPAAASATYRWPAVMDR